MLEYEWDELKARLNKREHGVDFADAVSALEDLRALTIVDDRDHDEERFVTVGTDLLGRVLVVVCTWRGERLRLISARRATPREQRAYGAPK